MILRLLLYQGSGGGTFKTVVILTDGVFCVATETTNFNGGSAMLRTVINLMGDQYCYCEFVFLLPAITELSVLQVKLAKNRFYYILFCKGTS